MEVLVIGLGWFAGLLITSFTIIPVLIIFRFGIPTARDFTKNGLLKRGNGAIVRYFGSAVLLSIIYIGAFLVAQNWSMFHSGFLLGTAWSAFFGLGRTGINQSNMTDFLKNNARYLTKTGKEFGKANTRVAGDTQGHG